MAASPLKHILCSTGSIDYGQCACEFVTAFVDTTGTLCACECVTVCACTVGTVYVSVYVWQYVHVYVWKYVYTL
jgi:hypothetical protein